MAENTYQTTIKAQAFTELAQELTGLGKILGISPDGIVLIELQAEDDWQLAHLCRDLEDSIEHTGYKVEIAKPRKVEPPVPVEADAT